MSTLVAQTISNGTVSTSSANVIQGSAKAWVSYDGFNAVIRGSFNVSSVTYNAIGRYTVNLTTAMPNANYAVAMSISSQNAGGASDLYGYVDDYTAARTTSAFRLASFASNGASFFGSQYLGAVVFSS
jgi:hypothetical protein